MNGITLSGGHNGGEPKKGRDLGFKAKNGTSYPDGNSRGIAEGHIAKQQPTQKPCSFP